MKKLSEQSTQFGFDFVALKSTFEAKYGQSNEQLICSLAPARVNLIGDHIDYNGGFVLPCAINRYLCILVRKNSSRTLSYFAADLNASFSFSIDAPAKYDEAFGFANYLNGCFAYLKESGFHADSGFDVLVSSAIPIGSGLSSSAALEIAFILAVAELFHLSITRTEAALLGKRVENKFMGLKSGIMDQFVVANAVSHTAMLLDTSSLRCEYIPLDLQHSDSQNGKDYSLVVMNSNKPRALVGSKYNERKRECEKAFAILKQVFIVPDLCSLMPQNLSRAEYVLQSACADKDEAAVLFKRVRHCVVENDLVKQAVAALREKDLKSFAEFFTKSHASLKNDYEVSGAELDSLVSNAIKTEGCAGARMTGAGFSGCAIALVETPKVPAFKKAVGDAYKKECNLEAEFYVCDTVNAAAVFEL